MRGLTVAGMDSRTDSRCLVCMTPTMETPVFIPVSTKATSICVLDVTGLTERPIPPERALDLVPATAFATFFP